MWYFAQPWFQKELGDCGSSSFACAGTKFIIYYLAFIYKIIRCFSLDIRYLVFGLLKIVPIIAFCIYLHFEVSQLHNVLQFC